DRVAIALQPDILALVRVDVFHPQLGRVGVRREGADGLGVDAGHDAARRNDDLDRRVAVQAVAPGQVVVVPGDGDGRLALGDGAGQGDDRHEVAGVIQLLEEVQTGGGVGRGAAVGDAGGHDRED